MFFIILIGWFLSFFFGFDEPLRRECGPCITWLIGLEEPKFSW